MALPTKLESTDSSRFEITRRHLLQGAAATLAGASLPLTLAGARSSGVRSYNLSPAPAKAQLLGQPGSPKTDVWAFSGNVPGPVIRARQGERLQIALDNGLTQETTLHCHGLRLPNAMDGVPGLTQAAIRPGQQFIYEFDLPDAGAYWYHPHINATRQVGRGLSGALIVEEKAPPRVDRELLWVVDDWRIGDDGALSDDFDHPRDISHGGRIGNLVTINGAEWDNLPVKAGERLRLRMINAANARVFGLRFEGMEVTVIALDGHPITPHAPPDGRVVFGPGQRVELILDIAGKPGDRLAVVDDYYQRFKYTLVTFQIDPGRPLRESPMDARVALPANPLAEPDLAQAETQQILIEGGAMGGLREAVYKGEKVSLRKLWRRHRKVWVLNGVASSGFTDDPMFRLKRGKSYRWRIRNDTAWDHPMHLHGHAFRIIARNGAPTPHTPWSDTVMVHADDTVEIVFVADNPGKWLFHCHVLEHHLGGMGGVVEVA